MRPRLALVLLLPLALAPFARSACAQRWPEDREDYGRRRADTAAVDTARRTLAGSRQVWGHVGIGWMASPFEARRHYTAGIDAGLSGLLRAGPLGLAAWLDYHDLPANSQTVYGFSGFPVGAVTDFGHGRFITGLVGGTVRAWNHLWLEGGAGGGHFSNGLERGDSTFDASRNAIVPVPAQDAWGGAWMAGARYEFQPTRRDRLLAELRYLAFDDQGRRLEFWAIRVGYRAL